MKNNTETATTPNYNLPALNGYGFTNTARKARVARLAEQFKDAPKDKPFKLMAETPTRGRMDICLASFDTLAELRKAHATAESGRNGDTDVYIEYPAK